MSESSGAVEAARRFIDTFNDRDVAGFVANLDPEVEILGMRGTRRGLDEAREWATRRPGGIQQTIEVDDLLSFDGDRVVALIRRLWWWEEDRERAGVDEMAWLFEVRDNRVMRWRPFMDRDEAIAAAGGA